MVKNPPASAERWETRSDPWAGKIPWRTAWQSAPGFLPRDSHGQRSLAGNSSQGRKEPDTTEVTQQTQALTQAGQSEQRGGGGEVRGSLGSGSRTASLALAKASFCSERVGG